MISDGVIDKLVDSLVVYPTHSQDDKPAEAATKMMQHMLQNDPGAREKMKKSIQATLDKLLQDVLWGAPLVEKVEWDHDD
jgi:hypothetical protein